MRNPLLRHLLLPALLALSMLLLGLWMQQSAAARYATASRAQATAKERLAQAQQGHRHILASEARIRANVAKFATWQASGLIGAERRGEWSESLQRVGDALRIPTLDYTLEPQRKLGPLDHENRYYLAASRMHLEAQVLHERQFLDMIEALKSGSAILRPVACTLSKLEQATRDAQLKASCELDWLSVLPAGENK